MTEPSGSRNRKPGRAAIDAQIDKLCRHALLQGDKRGELLVYLVRVQREGRYEHPFDDRKPPPTGKRILFEFYKHWAQRNGERDQWPTPDDSEEAGKKLIAELAEALDRYYKIESDALCIRIRRGRGDGYEPEFTWREETAPLVIVPKPELPHGEKVDCTYLGNNNAGVDYVIRRFSSGQDEEPRLIAFRDTHVRPRRLITNHVSYAGLQSALTEFLSQRVVEPTVATMIFGWDVDKEYLRAMLGAAVGRGDQFKCFRLIDPSPIMSFILLDYSDLSTEVLFGGGQGRPGPAGAVFRSKDVRLVDEFNALYDELLKLSERLPLRGMQDWLEA